MATSIDQGFLQVVLVMLYPFLTSVSLGLWGGYRTARLPFSKVEKAIRIGYIAFLALCVFPGAFLLFVVFTESCYGQGSGVYNATHPLLCGHELVLGAPWWLIVFYTLDILVLSWGVLRLHKSESVLLAYTLPVLYFFVVRIALLMLLGSIEHILV